MTNFVAGNGVAGTGSGPTELTLPACIPGDALVVTFASLGSGGGGLTSANPLTSLGNNPDFPQYIIFIGTVEDPDAPILIDPPSTAPFSSAVAIYRGGRFRAPRITSHGADDTAEIAAVDSRTVISTVMWTTSSVAAPSPPVGYDADFSYMPSVALNFAFAKWAGDAPSPAGAWQFDGAVTWSTGTVAAALLDAPAQRVLPREDALVGGGSPRVYPPPRSRQRGNRVVGGYW